MIDALRFVLALIVVLMIPRLWPVLVRETFPYQLLIYGGMVYSATYVLASVAKLLSL